MVATEHIDLHIKNEWLADLLVDKRDLITEYWIEDIRAAKISGYESITDERLWAELPPTVDSMIDALRTGDTEGPRKHSFGIIQRRLLDGFYLPDIQMSLHALEISVMRIVKDAELGPVKEFEALQTASNMYYMVALIAAAVYEQLRVEQQKRFATTYEFGLTLNKTLDLGVILDTAVDKVAEYIGGESVAILLAEQEGSRGEVRAYHNIDTDIVEAMPDICESIGCGMADMDNPDMRETACVIPNVRNHSHLDRWFTLLADHGHLSLLCAPLAAKQKRLGTLVLLWNEVHSASDTERGFLSAIAGHIANAIQNAFLYEDAKGKRELGVLLDASRLFASSLDTQDILGMIAKMATEAARADLAIVFTRVHMPEHSYTAYYIRNKRVKNLFPRIMEAVISEWEENEFSSLGREFAEGKAMLYQTCAEFPGRMGSLAGIGASGMLVPLRQKDEMIGGFAVISMVPNAFTQDDLSLATGLADLASIAIENAHLFEYERNIAETLQRSFLPSSLPSIEGYEIAAFYRPAMAEAEIGGDFYDVFTTGENDINIIIGDVSGKGLRSAVPTAMGKYIVRAYAAENLSPDNVMARFNRAFYENVPNGMFMTAYYGILDPKNNTFTYVSAGHNPPLLYKSATDQVNQMDIGGICLGIVTDVDYTDKSIQLEPGDVLLLYTDGATDVKGDGSRLEIEGLEQLLLSNAHESAEQIISNVSDGIWDFSHGRLPDDVVLIALKRL